MSYELRWLVRAGWDGPEQVLQYRCKEQRTAYGRMSDWREDYLVESVWTEWRDVDVINETKEKSK